MGLFVKNLVPNNVPRTSKQRDTLSVRKACGQDELGTKIVQMIANAKYKNIRKTTYSRTDAHMMVNKQASKKGMAINGTKKCILTIYLP